MKKCNRCLKLQNESHFSKTSYIKVDGSRGVRAYCKDCEWKDRRGKYQIHKPKIRAAAKARYKNDPEYREKVKKDGIYYRYGLKIEKYNQMREEQNYSCAICNDHESKSKFGRLFVDHNHQTGEVRALLCHMCNMALGAFDEDIERMRVAINYLGRIGTKG